MPSIFSKRSDKLEIMDDMNIPLNIISKVLIELNKINNLLGGYSASKNAFHKIGVQEGDVISDWGCGGGDSLRKIDEWCYKQNLPVKLIGVDFSESIINFATEKQNFHYTIDWICADVFSDKISNKQFDIIHSCLFTHHFKDEDWIKLIQKMQRSCTRAVIINDLHRNWFAYYSIKILTKIFSNSDMIKNDAPISVLRGFKRKELKDLLDKAGIEHYTISWFWAFRWQVIIYKK